MLVGLEFKPGDNRGHFNSLGDKFGLKNCQSQGGWRGADGFGKLWEGSINGFVDWTNALDGPVPWIKVRFLTGWWFHVSGWKYRRRARVLLLFQFTISVNVTAVAFTCSSQSSNSWSELFPTCNSLASPVILKI